MSRISNLDYLRKLLSGTVASTDKSPFNFPFPIMKTLGFKLIEVGEGTASMEMEAKTELHSNPMGTIHGGSCVTSPMRRLVQLILQLLEKGRASPVSICRSISFGPSGTRGLKRSLGLFTEEER